MGITYPQTHQLNPHPSFSSFYILHHSLHYCHDYSRHHHHHHHNHHHHHYQHHHFFPHKLIASFTGISKSINVHQCCCFFLIGNVAFGKHASTLAWDQWDHRFPGLAVDANTDAGYEKCYRYWANDDWHYNVVSPWWMVDLGEKHIIFNVTIYGPKGVYLQELIIL